MKKLFVLMVVLTIITVPAFAQVVVWSQDAETADYGDAILWGAEWGGGYVYDISVAPGPVYAGDASYWLHTSSGGSFGAAFRIPVTPGYEYTVSGVFKANSAGWTEVLFFNDDSRTMNEQCDEALADGSIVAKHSGGYPPSTFDWQSIADAPVPGGSLTKIATGNWMIVCIKAGNGGGGCEAWFDNLALTQTVVPEPSSLFALASGIGALGFGLRRRIR